MQPSAIQPEVEGSAAKLAPTRRGEAVRPPPKGSEKTCAANRSALDNEDSMMSKGVELTKGFIGSFNPEELRGRGSTLYWVTLPGVVRMFWELGFYPTHCPLLPLPADLKSYMMRRAAGPRLQVRLSWRTAPGNVAPTSQARLLSALTSALRIAGRA